MQFQYLFSNTNENIVVVGINGKECLVIILSIFTKCFYLLPLLPEFIDLLHGFFRLDKKACVYLV